MAAASSRTTFILLLLLSAVSAHADLPRQARLGAGFAAEEGKLILRQVAEDGNAGRAGLRNGDIVTAVDGQTAEAAAAFVRPLLRHPAQSKIMFSVLRGGKAMRIEVTYQPPPSEKPDGLTVEYASVPVNGHERRTLITIPKDKKKHDAILFLAGSGCASQESPQATDPAVQILYALTRRGYVTMRVEKTSMGDSGGPPCYSDQGDLAQEVAGYRAGYDALSEHPAVKGRRIYLFGHSAGGTLAPLVARDLKIAGIVAAGAMGTDFMTYIVAMRERERRLEGLTEEQVAKSVEVTRTCLQRLLIKGESPDAIEQSDPGCKKRVRFDSPPKYIEQWHRLDLSAVWAGLKAPVLVLYGSGDFVTSEAESRALVTRINAGSDHPEQARLAILPMDHGFQANATPERAWRSEQGVIPPPGLLSRVIDSIESFLIETQRR